MKKNLKLKSNRGKTKSSISGKKTEFCDNCRKWFAIVYEYKNSDNDPITLCIKCRPRILDLCFGKINPLDRASGGGFESNRRRH